MCASPRSPRSPQKYTYLWRPQLTSLFWPSKCSKMPSRIHPTAASQYSCQLFPFGHQEIGQVRPKGTILISYLQRIASLITSLWYHIHCFVLVWYHTTIASSRAIIVELSNPYVRDAICSMDRLFVGGALSRRGTSALFTCWCD